MKKTLTTLTVSIIMLTVFFTAGCKQQKPDNFICSYRLKEDPILSLTTDLSDKYQVFTLEDKVYVAVIRNDKLQIIDSDNDTLLKAIAIPQFRKIHSFSISDSSAFAIYADSVLCVYKGGKMTIRDIASFRDDCLPLPQDDIIYYPELDVVVSAVYSEEHLGIKPGLNHNFIRKYDLENGYSEYITFKYPKAYHDGMLGAPKFYFSKHANNLIISFEFDPNIYSVNLSSGNTETFSLTSTISKLDAFYPKKGSKKEKLDALQTNTVFKDGYGPAFYSEVRDQYWRIYRPALPVKDSLQGYYFSSYDIGCRIVQYDRSQDVKREYLLPNGVYYTPATWKLNPFNNTLVHIKVLKNERIYHRWNFYVHTIVPFSF